MPLPETAFYTAIVTRLLQKTEGFAAGVLERYYARAVTFTGATDYKLIATASIASSTGGSGFILGLDSGYFGLGGSSLSVHLNGKGVQFFALPPGFDRSDGVDYVITRAGSTVRLTANGSVLFDGTLTRFGAADRVIIGDGTEFANTTGYYSALSFNSAIPKTAKWAMLITGFGLAGAVTRRRRTFVAA